MSPSADLLNLKCVEDGAFSELRTLFTSNVVMEQFPNRIYPNGVRATLAEMESTFAKGRKLIEKQAYEIKNALVQGDSVSVEVLWTGTLAIGFGNLAPGSQMRCHSAMFFTFSEGKIAAQRNYDCFEPW